MNLKPLTLLAPFNLPHKALIQASLFKRCHHGPVSLSLYKVSSHLGDEMIFFFKRCITFSPINHKDESKRPKGLFFTANVNYQGNPVPISPFGDTRFLIPVITVLTDDIKLYFADFYCCYKDEKDIHSVVIVLAKSGVALDKRCQKYLAELDTMNNPFLSRIGHIWRVNTILWIEVLVTWDISLAEGIVDSEFKGYSKWQSTGKGSKEGCKICNIQPLDLESDLWIKSSDFSF